MYRIISKEKLADSIISIQVEAPLIAKKAKAGQFVIVVIDERGERIPLTLADWNESLGRIRLIFQEVGFTTSRLAAKNAGDSIAHILGPLGRPTDAKNLGRVICIGAGVGIAEIFPVSRALKSAGNRVTGIIGARRKDLLILEKEMQTVCSKLYVTTDDGSCGRKGFVTDALKEILTESRSKQINEKTALIYAIGPVVMMRAVCELTRSFRVKTIVSLNPIMVDATGMCGACRCSVAGETKFACVDGPDFDGHEVDFRQLEQRLNYFRKQEEEINKSVGNK